MTIPLIEVALEKRFGRLIPDVTARTSKEHGGVLLIEVTVTNTIQQQRQTQIQGSNMHALEIDLSRAGGMISRSELHDLVIEGIELKRWLCHPDADLCQQQLEAEAEVQIHERNRVIQDRESARQLILKTPIETIASAYLNAIHRYQTCARNGAAADFDEIASLLQEISNHAEQLAVHGFHEAKDDDLFGARSQIVRRILSIKNGGGVGYELDSTMGIMNAIKQAQVQNRQYHTVYLIAEAVYRKDAALRPPAWYQAWVEEIKRSIEAGDKMYVRTRRYDQLLSLLFPELVDGLKKSFGTEDYIPKRKETPAQQSRQHSMKGATVPKFWPSDVDKSSEASWLKGSELERWIKNNPAAARAFFRNRKKVDE